MKRFIRDLLLLAGLFVLVFGAAEAVVYRINTRIVSGYRFGPGVHTLFAGDSHTMMGIDPALLPGSANVGEVAEPAIYSYYKLKALCKNNPGIRRIYFGFSPYYLSGFHKRFISGAYAEGFAAKYFYVLPPAGQRAMLARYAVRIVPFLGDVFREGVQNARVRRNDYPFIGGYQNSFDGGTGLYRMQARLAELYPDSASCTLNASNIFYLQQLAAWCRQEGIELVVLDLPVHPYIRAHTPACIGNAYERTLQHEQLKRISFEGLALPDNCFSPDGDHLSRRGAAVVTGWLRDHGY